MPESSEVKETKQKDGAKVKAYLQGNGHKKTNLDKLKWTTPDKIIESVVKLHNHTMETYLSSGLG